MGNGASRVSWLRIIAPADTSIGPPQSATTDVGQRPAFVSPSRERGQARPQGMDSARVTAQFPVPALKLWVTIEEITHLVGAGSMSVASRVASGNRDSRPPPRPCFVCWLRPLPACPDLGRPVMTGLHHRAAGRVDAIEQRSGSTTLTVRRGPKVSCLVGWSTSGDAEVRRWSTR
jgi:hypothetical protein